MHLQYYKLHLFAPIIFRAVRIGDVDRTKKLIAAGADVNTRERDGLTPLMLASLRGGNAIVQLLIQSGASINAQDNKGMTPLLFTSVNYKRFIYEIKKYIYRMRNSMTLDGKINYLVYYPAFHDAYTAVAKVLILNGADVNKSDVNAWTPLMYASSAGNEQMVELLISKGADVNSVNRDGATALMVSLTGISSVNIVKLLIENGADVNAADNDGVPVMAFASIKKNQEILQLLRDKGAKGEINDNCRSRT